jgi:predicted HTH transcriptional regulator
MPTVDYSDMDSGQSDIRNKTLAPVFKRLGIIEQWGNGLQLIADELKAYPEIELSWKEPGIAFRVTFMNKSYKQQYENKQKLQPSGFSKILNLVFKGLRSNGLLKQRINYKRTSIAASIKELSNSFKYAWVMATF